MIMQSQTFIRLQVLLRTTPDYLHKHSIFIISRYFSQHFFKFNLTRKFVRSYGAIIWLQKKKPIAQMSHQPQAWKVKRLAVERQILNNCFFFPLRSLMSLISWCSDYQFPPNFERCLFLDVGDRALVTVLHVQGKCVIRPNIRLSHFPILILRAIHEERREWKIAPIDHRRSGHR